VKGDPHILAMAVSNLVSNALKFTDKGEVRISWDENNGDVVISVSDTGKGILKKNQKKIFRKYFKENHNSPGSGIGLTVSYGLVKKMGGKMAFRSIPGKGSTFTIKVPKEVKT
jgi:signal transduction histidine kinase